MKLLKIHFGNINSLCGEFSIDFRDGAYKNSGLFVITGPTGSGKSSILDAITLALFATTARKETQATTDKETGIVLSKGKTKCFSEVLFESQGKRYLSRWSLRQKRSSPSRKNATSSYEEHVDLAIEESDGNFRSLTTKKREWTQAIADVVGLSYEAFMRTVVLAQGAFANFLKADNRLRSELLERITHTEIYSQIGQEIALRFSASKAELKKWDDVLSTLQLFSAQDRSEKEMACKEAVRKSQIQADKLEALQEELAWKKEFNKKEQVAKQAKFDLIRAQERQNELQPLKAIVQAAEKAKNLWPSWTALQEFREKRTKTIKDLQLADNNRQKAIISQKEAEEKAAQLSQAAAKLSQDAATYRDRIFTPWLLEKERLNSTQTNIEKVETQLRNTQRALCAAKKKAAQMQMNLLEQKTELRRITYELNEHAADDELEETLPQLHADSAAIDVQDEKLQQLADNCRKMTNELAILQAKLSAARTEEDALRLASSRADMELEEAKKHLAICLSGNSWMQKIKAAQLASGQYWAAQWAWQCQMELKAIVGAQSQTTDPTFCNYLHSSLLRQKTALETITKAFPSLQRELSDSSILQLRSALDDWKNWSLQASQAQSTLDPAQSRTNAARLAFQKTSIKTATLEEQCHRAKHDVQEKQSEIAAADNNLKQTLSEFSLRLKKFFIQGTVPARTIALKQLTGRWKTYQHLTQELLKVQQNLLKTQNEASSDFTSLQALQLSYKDLQEASSSAHKELCRLQEKINAQFGQDNVPEHMQQLQTQVDKFQKEAEQINQILLQEKSKAAAAQTLVATLAQQKNNLEQEYGQKQIAFDQALRELGFADSQALEAAYRAPAVLEGLERELQQAAATLISAQLQNNHAQKEFQKIQEKKISTETVNILLERIDFTKEEKEKVDRQIGILQEQLHQDDLEREKKAKWDAQRKRAQSNFSLYSELNTLAGLQDGSRLRNFVQRWTFRLLLKEANFYLHRMRSRYSLIPFGSQGLDCAVQDADMAGLTRTAANLSGGETFLVSLALALALSRISSRGLRMDSLFLDEGFGTLDPVTLENALTALENLQADTNKLIGLISHVEEVSDRIDTHIEVKPRGATGWSTVIGPGIIAKI